MRSGIIILLLLFSSVKSYSQITFQQVYGTQHGDFLFSVIQTSDSGYLMSGGMYNYSTLLSDIYLVKTNEIGDTLWTRLIGTYNKDWCYNTYQTNDGGYIVSGVININGPYVYDFYLIKLDSLGIPQWSKSFGSPGNDDGAYAISTQDGGIILSGMLDVFGLGTEACLIKMDDSSNIEWSRTYGGFGNEIPSKIIETSDNGFIIVGTTDTYGAGGFNDGFLLKTDSAGNMQWMKTYGGSGEDNLYDVVQTSNGGFLITGATTSFSSNKHQGYLIKTDSLGNMEWSNTIDCPVDLYFSSCNVTPQGDFVSFGYSNTTVGGKWKFVLMKTDTLGNLVWANSYTNNIEEYGYSFMNTLDGGFILAGTTGAFFGPTYYLVKTDSSGYSVCNSAPFTPTILAAATVSTFVTPNVATAQLTIGTPNTIFASGSSLTNVSILCRSTYLPEPGETSFNKPVIYPNPATESVHVKFDLPVENGTIRILNTIGEKVYEGNLNHLSDINIPVNHLISGIYFIHVLTELESSSSKLIVLNNK